MTEEEYIHVSALANARSARRALTEGVIPEAVRSEFVEARVALSRAIDTLSEGLEIESEAGKR